MQVTDDVRINSALRVCQLGMAGHAVKYGIGIFSIGNTDNAFSNGVMSK